MVWLYLPKGGFEFELPVLGSKRYLVSRSLDSALAEYLIVLAIPVVTTMVVMEIWTN